MPDGPEGNMVDIFEVACHCGSHKVKVFIDMYKSGPDEPIGLAGWKLAPKR